MDGQKSGEAPEIYVLRLEDGNWRISRRDFLKAAGVGAAAAGAGVIGGCSPKKPEDTAETAAVSTAGDSWYIEVSGVDSETGKTQRYSTSCGSPLPEGSVCTCNCVRAIPDWCITYAPATPTPSAHYWHPN